MKGTTMTLQELLTSALLQAQIHIDLVDAEGKTIHYAKMVIEPQNSEDMINEIQQRSPELLDKEVYAIGGLWNCGVFISVFE